MVQALKKNVNIGTGNMRGIVWVGKEGSKKVKYYTTPQAKKLGLVKSTKKRVTRKSNSFNSLFGPNDRKLPLGFGW